MSQTTITIHAKYRCGYFEYHRIWNAAARKLGPWPDYFNLSTLVSPRGTKWRHYGVGAGCPRFRQGDVYRDIDYGTVLRALMLGWTWVSDRDQVKEAKRYSIRRWQDGEHYYVTSDHGDSVTESGCHKFDTWDLADAAGQRWQAKTFLAGTTPAHACNTKDQDEFNPRSPATSPSAPARVAIRNQPERVHARRPEKLSP